ncbi:type II restriction endonuclease [Erwinia sp. ACCC 02193]|uniref:Type II restriction endonuclease n=1 Tax=Erwinia aeris TaxID=3239803 RepID=A0ABV4E684_9GAMM
MNSKTIRLAPACIKTLTKVEVDKKSSHQHEFNGVFELRGIFGPEKRTFLAKFSIRGQDVFEKTDVTWYEARENHPVRSEYRLYFKENIVMENASVGDNIIIGFDDSQQLNFILIKKDGPGYNGLVQNWTPL